MRIACIHVPQFALQCATRVDPSLRGAPLAVVAGGDAAAGDRALRAPVVVACSRAAWSAGVRAGMTAPTARSQAPNVAIVPLGPAIEHETIRAIGDALGGIADAVDLGAHVGPGGAHYAVYAALPARTRGNAFGERAVAILDQLGLSARVGIADDRFTAWVAAVHAAEAEHEVVSVPRGGAAAFLAPRPLSLLAIAPEVQHMLAALGVTTLGEFAKLPAPSVARPFAADYQALARGEGGAALHPHVADEPIREQIAVTAGNVLDAPGAISGVAAIALVARRVALRLEGRGHAARELEIRAGEDVVTVELERPVHEAEAFASALEPVLARASASAWRLRVAVTREVEVTGAAAAVDTAAQPALATRAAEPATIDPLAMVLATTGAAELHAWTLQPPSPHGLRRDIHRRTRRGKRRPRVEAAQSPLFDSMRR